MFEILLGYAEESDSEVVSCGFFFEYQLREAKMKRPLIGDKKLNSTEAIKALINGDIGKSVWCKLWEKECFADIRFPQGHVFEDAATIYRVFYNIKYVRSIPCALYHYRIREGSIIQSKSIGNLVDLWLAVKTRREFLLKDVRFNTDVEVIERLTLSCAVAIAETWKWYYVSTTKEREQYALQMGEMRAFSQQHFPRFGKRKWSLKLRFCIFMQKLDSPVVFPVLYYLTQFCRWYRKRQLA